VSGGQHRQSSGRVSLRSPFEFEGIYPVIHSREPDKSSERQSDMEQSKPWGDCMSDRLMYSAVGGLSVIALVAVAAIVLAGL
jgi:hypothetical protein